jgi:hypothetical protein
MIKLTVSDYKYISGQGAQICDGARIVATVNGTSCPVGSACQADVDLARIMAAGPEMLAALQAINESLCTNRMQDDDIAALIQPIIAKAVQS